MSAFLHLEDFLSPVNIRELNDDHPYDDFQAGSAVRVYTDYFPDLDEADIVLVGAGEERGGGRGPELCEAPNRIRRQLYRLYHWQEGLKLADVGNIRKGATLEDSYAALKTVVAALIEEGKTVIILGGSHDLTLAQYRAYASLEKIIEATVIDALIDLRQENLPRSGSFLMEMFTGQPNFLRHYNHVGFQSYFTHPRMLETLDKLRFDCYRLGKVRENIEEIEPVLRNSDMLSFDITAIKHADAPANDLSPNGFAGDEACSLTRYAGMGSRLSSFGIYGYDPAMDESDLTAKQIAQMIWYFIEGKAVCLGETTLQDKEGFWEFHVAFTDVETTFLKSKKTARWWMQLPDGKFIPCAYADYLQASNNEVPERWLRAQERM